MDGVVLAAPKPAITGYALRTIVLHLGDEAETLITPESPPDPTIDLSRIEATYHSLPEETGRTLTAAWTGAEARALLLALNTTNLSVKSLTARVNERVLQDHKIAAFEGGAVLAQ